MALSPNDSVIDGKSRSYRDASEALHRDHSSHDRNLANLRMLWRSGLADLIRDDFYQLFGPPTNLRGHLLDAGCGNGMESMHFQRIAPAIRAHGVDVSSVMLAEAMQRPERGAANFYQAALERLPFADATFDVISSHEVIEHVEDPAVVLREFNRVLRNGGLCVIATPNGASLWIDQLYQRARRLFGKRGAPVGADHTQPPSYWRRQFTRAGFAIEYQIFDGVALEFQIYFAKASWMRTISRALEPLRVVPVLRLLLCDRVKFRLRKPGVTEPPLDLLQPCCPICFANIISESGRTTCGNGHRFAWNAAGLPDFTSAPLEPKSATETPIQVPEQKVSSSELAPAATPAIDRVDWIRLLRRSVVKIFGVVYGGLLLMLAPLGLAVGLLYQPFQKLDRANASDP